MEVLALIPARGGSKSIPRKNIMTMIDRPLLAWSIYHAEKSKYINRVIVSTDDNEISEIALKWGAEVPFLRPSNISDDESLDIDVFKHTLKWLKENENYCPDLVVHLRPTGPARKIGLIDKAIKLMSSRKDVDSLRSISLAEQTPFKMWILNKDKTMRPASTLNNVKDAHSIGRQMLPKAYWQNGYVDITRPSTVLEKSSMVGDSILPFIIKDKIHDLDYPEDIPIVASALKDILEGNNDDSIIETERHPV